MAINDISLTSGMRSNLLSLQNTVNLLDRTQTRLATGKKVNSAIDNATSFFAAQSLNSRASTIDSLKDAMGQAVSTLKAADKGISAITSLIEQAKGIAQQALSADINAGFDTDQVTINGLAIGDTITVGGTTLTAGPTAVTTSTAYNSYSMTTVGVDAGDTVVVGGVTFTGTAGSTTTAYDNFQVDFNFGTGPMAGDTVTVGGVTYTASTGAGGLDFDISGGAAGAATSLAARIAAVQGGAYGASAGSGILTVTAGTTDLAAGTVTASYSTVTPTTHTVDNPLGATEFLVGADNATATNLRSTLQAYFGAGYTFGVATNVVTMNAGTIGLNATSVQAGTALPGEIAIAANTTVTTAAGALAAGEFAVTGDDIIDAQAMANLINNTAAITALNYTATASNGVLSIANTAADVSAANVTVSDAAKMVELTVAGTSELTDLVAQYNTVRNQIDALAGDSGYKGKNLLSSDINLRTLDVKFEGATLTVNGFDATTTGLAVSSALNGAGTTWTNGVGEINASIDQLDAALSTLRQQSSKMSGNLSIITVRQDFSTNIINTLTEGADKLTAADSNEEGANMLMLQTRQSLSTTALSLSAQAAQSVLKLFG